MLKNLTIPLWVLLALLIAPAFAESNNNGWHIEKSGISFHGGRIVPHDKDIRNLDRGSFVMTQLTLSGRVKGNKPWHSRYNYPVIGLNFLYADLSYPQVLGEAFAFFPHIAFDIFTWGNLSVGHNQGAGIAYLTRPFHASTNPDNMGIGSALNIAYHMTLEARWFFTPAVTLYGGFSFTHFSNGRFRTPNKGLNIPTVKLGFTHRFTETTPPLQDPDTKPEGRRLQLYTLITGGVTSTYPPGGPLHERYSFQSTLHYPLNLKTGAGAGYDFFYSERKEESEEHGTLSSWHNLHGVHIAWHQRFSRLSFIFNKGLYLYDRIDFNDSKFYHRVGFRYDILNGLLLNISLKSHFFQAENLEWGLGYRF